MFNQIYFRKVYVMYTFNQRLSFCLSFYQLLPNTINTNIILLMVFAFTKFLSAVVGPTTRAFDKDRERLHSGGDALHFTLVVSPLCSEIALTYPFETRNNIK